MKAGALRERITIQRETLTPDDTGGATRTFTTLGTLAARITPTGGREAVIGAMPRSVQAFKVEVRYSAHSLGITARDRIVWGARTLNLRTGFEDVDGTSYSLVAYADEGIAE